ncbi:MAG: hypothetical protein OXG49_02225 [Chloroflexi bacterium]|nr:hypothetical protein [Chloroflexota bacterium]
MMRYLHPIQAHERFLASGCYRFGKNGQTLVKTESWTLHAHPDGEKFVRVDMDARQEEGKSLLAEALLDIKSALVRFDIRYESDQFEGGIKHLRATYQRADERLQIGYRLNRDERKYIEVDLPDDALIDLPLLVFRGRTIKALAERSIGLIPIYVPMFEHAQLFPGVLRRVASPVERAGDDTVFIGKRAINVGRFRYRDQAVSYWIDQHDLIVKRVNSFKQQEMTVAISNYAAPARTA